MTLEYSQGQTHLEQPGRDEQESVVPSLVFEVLLDVFQAHVGDLFQVLNDLLLNFCLCPF